MANKIYRNAVAIISMLAILIAWTGLISIGYAATSIDVVINKNVELPDGEGKFIINYTYENEDGQQKINKEVTKDEYLTLVSELADDETDVQIHIDDADDTVSNKKITVIYETEALGYNVIDSEITDKVYVGYNVLDDGTLEENTSHIVNSKKEDKCQCEIIVNKVDPINETVAGKDAKFEATINELKSLISYTLDTSNCQIHKRAFGNNVDISFKISEQSNGNGEITSDLFMVTGFTVGKTYTANIEATLSFGEVSAIANIPVEITVSDGSPIITGCNYNSETGDLTVTIKPNGTSAVDIYLGIPQSSGSTDITETRIAYNEPFDKFLFWTRETTFKINIGAHDHIRPNPVDISTVSARRSSDDPRIIEITWDDPGDKENIVQVYAKPAGEKDHKSNSYEIDLKSDRTWQYVEVKYRDKDDTSKSYVTYPTDADPEGTTLISMFDGKAFKISLDNVHWDAYLTFISIDRNNTDITTQGEVKSWNLPNNLIYTSYSPSGLPIKEVEITEGESVELNTEEIDILALVHDKAWEYPNIISGETDNTYGSIEIRRDDNGQYNLVVYNSIVGYTNDREVKYTYEKVREDIPALFGTYNIKIKAVNQAPVANDDSTSVTDVLNAKSGTVIDIPASLLLANDTDREDSVDKLKISRVTNPSTGTIDLLSLNGKQVVRFTPSSLFYGLATFQYMITDSDGGESIDLATVQINIEKQANPPKAQNVETVMELTETSKSVSLNVDNAGGEAYELKEIGKPYVNGVLASSSYGIKLAMASVEDEKGNLTPYIKLTVSQNSGLKNGDKITFTYTVGNSLGTSTANITVEMTNGDDPNDMEGYLYVHRKPIASFNPIIRLDSTKTYVDSVTIGLNNEQSYDLDHNLMHNSSNPIEGTQSDSYEGQTRPFYSWKGIRAWEWGYKTLSGDWITRVFDVQNIKVDANGQSSVAGEGSDDDISDLVAKPSDSTDKYSYAGAFNSSDEARAAGISWIQSELNNLIASQKATGTYDTIIVSLRVRDIDGNQNIGVWSDQRTIMLTSLPLPPVAQFTTDKASYTASSKTPLNITVIDMSYDPNGDPIANWNWELTDADGKVIWTQNRSTSDNNYVSTQVSSTIQNIVANPNWNPSSNDFTLKLVVTEQTSARLESDPYSVTFKVYKNNEPPVIDDSNTSMDLNGSTVYEEDDGSDGKVGDDWGTLTNNNGHPGKVNFKDMFDVTDDQDLSKLTIGWLLEGESVERRSYWSEDRRVLLQKAYTTSYDKASNGPMAPFFNTVTEQGFIPGAYRISVTVKDNPPTTGGYAPNSSQTSYWVTNGDKEPYHLYVVPKLYMSSRVEFNGWVLSYSDKGGYLENLSYRISDGKTAQELGVSLEDIVPTIGDTVTIRCVTNKYATDLYGFNDYYSPFTSEDGPGGNNGYTSGEEKFNMSKLLDNPDKTGETYTWVGTYTIEDIDDAKEGEEFTDLRLALHGSTIWGSETGAITRTKEVLVPIKVLPVKLYDFRVTEVTDPKIASTFNAYIENLKSNGETLDNGSITDGVLVRHLAVDNNSKPSSYTSDMDVMSKGYSFYFKLNSKGLTKDTDEIRIYPRIYQVITDKNGNITSIGRELVGCVPDNTGKYQVYTHNIGDKINQIDSSYELKYSGEDNAVSLNSHRELIIPTELRTINGSEQTWYGRYGVPADARFFFKDTFESQGNKISTDNEWRGDILITFDIQAFKKGSCRYNYVQRSQWLKEREEPSIDNLKTLYIDKEADWFKNGNTNGWLGSVIVYDSSKSVRDDYTSNPVWRE